MYQNSLRQLYCLNFQLHWRIKKKKLLLSCTILNHNFLRLYLSFCKTHRCSSYRLTHPDYSRQNVQLHLSSDLLLLLCFCNLHSSLLFILFVICFFSDCRTSQVFTVHGLLTVNFSVYALLTVYGRRVHSRDVVLIHA